MPSFTQLFDETFSGPNANPIDPAKWTTAVGGIPFQQLNHFLVCASPTLACNMNYTAVSLPADQYLDVTIHNAENGSDCEIVLRANADQTEAYVLYVDSFGDGTADSAMVSYVGGVANEIFDFGTIPFIAGDVFRFGVLGTTLYGYRNGIFLGSVVNTDHASGFTGLFMAGGPASDVNALQISRFSGGTTGTTAAYSVPDSRNYANFPNDSRDIQGTQIYDVPSVFSLRYWFDALFNRTQPLPLDSRVAGETTDSRVAGIIPQNSRTPGTFGPGE